MVEESFLRSNSYDSAEEFYQLGNSLLETFLDAEIMTRQKKVYLYRGIKPLQTSTF
jgi:hypothetical protein